MVIAFAVSDAKIENDLRKLTADGKIVFLALSRDCPDARNFHRRYGQSAEGFVLADEFGNLLKSDLTTSSDAIEAVNSLDELTGDLIAQWSAALEQARPLVEQKQFAEAAKIVQVFAFAAGGEKAKEGKRLYDQVAANAKQEYESLTKEMPAGKLADAARQEWAAKLSGFVRKWPKTPAAFAAEDRLGELGT